MATAHLIHGFLGVGKTTFSRRLEQELPAVRYTHDEWMARLYGIDPPAEHFAEYRDAVFDIMNAHWPRVLACGADVILDFGFWTRASRDEARARAAAVGALARLYRLECPEAIARARCRARNLKPDGSLVITENTFDILRTRFQPLEADEVCETVKIADADSPG